MSQTALRIVIVGGVAGGASAATRARRMNERAEIILFEKDEHVSFANCGLPYYIGGEIQNRAKLLVATPELFAKRFRIEVRTRHEVRAIDRATKTVTVHDRNQGSEYQLSYDKLILAPGAAPLVPPLPGADAPNVYTLRNLVDADRIYEAAKTMTSRQAVVVGAGFIGLEMVEQLVGLGFQVSLAELQPQVLPLMDAEMVQPLADELRERGVGLVLGDGIQRVVLDDSGRAVGIELASGQRIAGGMVILGLGVRPQIRLAQEAGLEIGAGGGIATNRYMQTTDPDIYAVGDAAECRFGVTGTPLRVALAGPANRAGRLAGEHAATGTGHPIADVFGTAIVRVFRQTAASTGLTMKLATRLKLPARSVVIVAGSHAGYYPGAAPITLKLTYDPQSGRVLGAQAVGQDGIDKRIDVIATALAMKATVWDLAGLDLAYAPPFGSAKDPIHQAAFAACNELAGLEAFAEPNSDLSACQVIDVRTAAEVAQRPLAQVPQVIAIPVDELRDRLHELDANADTVVACGVGMRGHVASRILRQHGFTRVRNLTGGAELRARAVQAAAPPTH
jgi:NADPH-dependent 2,4-dienoyl-CoA reductase/sulfur reductase-like enzyme/rhodanese-related sulfurtransferase